MADRKGDRVGDPRDKDTRVRDYEAGQGRQRGSIGTGEERRGAASRDTGPRGGVAGRETARGPRKGAAGGGGRSRRGLWLGLLALLLIIGGIALIASAGLLNQPQGPAPAPQDQGQQGGQQGQSPPQQGQQGQQQAAGEPPQGQNQSSNQNVSMETTT